MSNNIAAIIEQDEDGLYNFRRVSYQGDGLPFLQQCVGGYIECVTLNDQIDMWCNEEGKLAGLPINEAATSLWWDWQPAMRNQDVIAGPVVLTCQEGGETTSLSEDAWASLRDHLAARFFVTILDEVDPVGGDCGGGDDNATGG